MTTPAEARVLVPMSVEECWRTLPRHGVGRVVFVDIHGPVALPVNYVLDHEDIVFRTAPSSSILATPATGRVSFEIDEIDAGHRVAWSVLATGTVRRVEDPAELRHVTWLQPTPWANGERDRYLRLSVQRVTGRRLVPDDAATDQSA